MPFGIGSGELFVIMLIVLLVFGAKRLPEIGESLGKGIRDFKRSLNEAERTIRAPESGGAPPTVAPPAPSRAADDPKKLSE